MKREDVFDLINIERDYQDKKWGGKSHDENHELGSWLVYIEHYLNKAKVECATATNMTEALNQVLKLTALGVACLEYLDELSTEDIVFGEKEDDWDTTIEESARRFKQALDDIRHLLDENKPAEFLEKAGVIIFGKEKKK